MYFDLKKVHFFYICKLLYYNYNNGRPTGTVIQVIHKKKII